MLFSSKKFNMPQKYKPLPYKFIIQVDKQACGDNHLSSFDHSNYQVRIYMPVIQGHRVVHAQFNFKVT